MHLQCKIRISKEVSEHACYTDARLKIYQFSRAKNGGFVSS